jgi:predicted nucleic acid-binding protein
MLVVSDTSPVTALLQIGQCELLARLFDAVLIPPAVKSELLRFHPSLPEYLEVREVRQREAVDALREELDRGEAEAIVLAAESRADYVLMDEKRGRAVAESRGLTVIGLLGALLMAKRAGHVASLRELIASLESRAGFFVSDAVKAIILTAAGEVP